LSGRHQVESHNGDVFTSRYYLPEGEGDGIHPESTSRVLETLIETDKGHTVDEFIDRLKKNSNRQEVRKAKKAVEDKRSRNNRNASVPSMRAALVQDSDKMELVVLEGRLQRAERALENNRRIKFNEINSCLRVQFRLLDIRSLAKLEDDQKNYENRIELYETSFRIGEILNQTKLEKLKAEAYSNFLEKV